MKVVVIGGTGLIGSKLVAMLRSCGQVAIAASPNTGVDTLTGQGLAEALKDADVVVDVANSPSFEDRSVMDFFLTSTRNLLAAEAKAGVKHHVALSIVGTQRLGDSGYMRAKAVQENLIRNWGVPYTIVESTQFFEFIERIAKGAEVDGVYRVSPALIQPIAAADVVAALTEASLSAPLNGVIEIGGPQAAPLDELARQILSARGDPKPIVADVQARYFGALLNDKSLVPGPKARLGAKRFDDWLRQSITAD